jgi:putative transposase
MTAEIKARGLPVSRERVRKLMHTNRIRAHHERRHKEATKSAHNLPAAEDWLCAAVVIDL